MKIIYRQISLPPDIPAEYACQTAVKRAGRAGIKASGASVCRISVDSRKKNDIKTVYSVIVECDGASDDAVRRSGGETVAETEISVVKGTALRHGKICVIGFGPAGIFAALTLAENGYDTVVFERGGSVDERYADTERFKKTGVLNVNSNVQFGAGGAGTFSDGKLITRINDPACSDVLKRLVSFGAPEDILINARPHIGTDLLTTVIKNADAYLRSLDVQIRYNTKVEKITQSKSGAEVCTGDGEEYFDAVVLACGHSARDTYASLIESSVAMEAKPFSVGCRIEHPQDDIDRAMYGDGLDKYREYLPHAEYNLSYRDGERGVYSFCMCPGGRVICASTEADGIVTNGMSYHKRDGKNANSAVAVSVLPSDHGGGVLSGIEFQRRIETAAFLLTGSFKAPTQTVGSFLHGGKSVFSDVLPTFEPGTVEADIKGIMPGFVNEMLATGISVFDRKIKGFAIDSAVLTAPETRTSAPVRVTRGADGVSLSAPYLYPCGEGAGYAGGITSAAADGINTALKIMKRFKPDR